jgi:hypothetical protein
MREIGLEKKIRGGRGFGQKKGKKSGLVEKNGAQN